MDDITRRSKVVRLLCSIAILSCANKMEAQPAAAAATILYNGKIITVDDEFSMAEAVAITDGRFAAVGADAAIRALARESTVEIDLGGRTVVPGFMDGHLHSAGGGPGVDLSRARTLEDVLDAIATRADATPTGELIVTNSDWHEAQLAEQRLPLRDDLDQAAPEHPVIVVRGGHEFILNTPALERWGINEAAAEPLGGQISRYADGRLNGELLDAARALVDLPPPPEQSLDEQIEERVAVYDKLHQVGLTTVRHPGGPPEEYRVIEEMKRRGLLTMRVAFLLRPRGRTAADIVQEITASNLSPRQGDAWLRVDGIKLGVDGGFEGGWMREPYLEPWGRDRTFHGINTMARDVYVPLIQELNRRNWRVSTHAVGDAAIDLVLAGYAAADAEHSIADKRWVIEHGFVPAEDQFQRMRELGIVVSAQNHLYVAGPSLEKYWGKERAALTTPMRRYLDEGIHVAAGTDAPVIPYEPLGVFYHFVTRDTLTGGVFGADQAIAREEALRLLTVNNAYLMFEEDAKGSIEPGKYADLVVLSEDILSIPATSIRSTAVLMTMVGGRIVFVHDSFDAAPGKRR